MLLLLLHTLPFVQIKLRKREEESRTMSSRSFFGQENAGQNLSYGVAGMKDLVEENLVYTKSLLPCPRTAISSSFLRGGFIQSTPRTTRYFSFHVDVQSSLCICACKSGHESLSCCFEECVLSNHTTSVPCAMKICSRPLSSLSNCLDTTSPAQPIFLASAVNAGKKDSAADGVSSYPTSYRIADLSFAMHDYSQSPRQILKALKPSCDGKTEKLIEADQTQPGTGDSTENDQQATGLS